MAKLKHASEIFLCNIRARLQGFVIFFQIQITGTFFHFLWETRNGNYEALELSISCLIYLQCKVWMWNREALLPYLCYVYIGDSLATCRIACYVFNRQKNWYRNGHQYHIQFLSNYKDMWYWGSYLIHDGYGLYRYYKAHPKM